jgi:hypothetical protein
MVLPVAVTSNWKSRAQTWSGRWARSRSQAVVESPRRWRLRRLGGTRKPSSRHSRWIFLRFTTQRSRRNTACARR